MSDLSSTKLFAGVEMLPLLIRQRDSPVPVVAGAGIVYEPKVTDTTGGTEVTLIIQSDKERRDVQFILPLTLDLN